MGIYLYAENGPESEVVFDFCFHCSGNNPNCSTCGGTGKARFSEPDYECKILSHTCLKLTGDACCGYIPAKKVRKAVKLMERERKHPISYDHIKYLDRILTVLQWCHDNGHGVCIG